MPIVCATDDSLRKHISDNECVFVAYITTDCPVCNTLMPSIRLLAQKQAYENIHFVEIDANLNPVAKIEMMEKQLPFVVTYKNGLLIECETVSTEFDVQHKLINLAC